MTVKEQPASNMLVFGSQNNFEQAMRMAKCLSASSIVPEIYRGETGLPNCIIALEMSNRIGASPLLVMQNLYMVHGNPGWSSKFLIATINTCGKFSPLRYEHENRETEKWRCRAFAKDKTGETLYGAWVSIEMAKKEGWFGKSGSKWQTMPELMLQYRAAAFFQRTYAPEISMGMHTTEELFDIEEAPYEDVTGKVKKEVETNANKEEINLAEPKAPGATVSEKETVQPKQSQSEAQKQEENQPPKPVGKQPIPSFMQQQ